MSITGTAAEINAALAGLAYTGNPNFSGSDTLTVTTDDGAAQDIDTVAITVNPVNDRPVLDLDADNSSGAAGTDYTTTFTEGGAAVAVADLDDLVTDVDNPNLTSATITLANLQAGDLLAAGPLPPTITASLYDPATGVLTLTGSASLAEYETALRQVVFSNSSPIPSATDRIINIVVNDGAASSFGAHAFVHVLPVDTAPALDLDADDSSGADRCGLHRRIHRRRRGGSDRRRRHPGRRCGQLQHPFSDDHADQRRGDRPPPGERDTAAGDHRRLRSGHRHPHAERLRAARRLPGRLAADRVRQQRPDPAHGDARHRSRRQ